MVWIEVLRAGYGTFVFGSVVKWLMMTPLLLKYDAPLKAYISVILNLLNH